MVVLRPCETPARWTLSLPLVSEKLKHLLDHTSLHPPVILELAALWDGTNAEGKICILPEESVRGSLTFWPF